MYCNYDPYSPFAQRKRARLNRTREERSNTEEKLLAIALTIGLFVVLIFANVACNGL